MNKIKSLKCCLFIALATALSMALIGCGSSGGSSGQADADLQYSGITTPAVIDAANADQLAGEALEAGGTGSSVGMIGGGDLDSSEPQARLRSIHLPLNLKNVAVQSDPAAAPLFINGVLVRVTGRLTDKCGFGGYVDYDKSYEDVTGAFSATYWFYDYCDKGSFINGVVSSSGYVNPADPNELLTATQRFRKLTDGSATLSGSINVNMAGTPVAIVFNALIRDDATAKVYWIKDYTLQIWEYADYAAVDISGTFYNPDHGFIRLTTESLLEIATSDEHPRAGAIIVEGASNAKVRLAAIDSNFCRIEADTDGDGDYDDFVADSIPWDDL